MLLELSSFGYGEAIIRLPGETVISSSAPYSFCVQALGLPAATLLNADHSRPIS